MYSTLEGVIGCVFVALLLVGLGFLIVGSNTRENAEHRARRLKIGIAAEAAAFIFYGLIGFFLTRTSVRPWVSGVVTGLHQSSGKYPSSDFKVVSSSNTSRSIHADYNGNGLREGQPIRVHFVQYDGTLLNLESLTPDEPLQIAESDDSISCIFLFLMGAVLGPAGLWEQRRRHASNCSAARVRTTL